MTIEPSVELPRRQPRDQIVAEARSTFSYTYMRRVEKPHGLDLYAASSLLAIQVARIARLARGGAAQADTMPLAHGLTGAPAEILRDVENLVEECRTGKLVYDDESTRVADPTYLRPEPLTNAEMIDVLTGALHSRSSSLVRVERNHDRRDPELG